MIQPKLVKKPDPVDEKVPTILDQWKPKEEKSLKKKNKKEDKHPDETYITDDDEDNEDDYNLKYQAPLHDLVRKAELNVSQ